MAAAEEVCFVCLTQEMGFTWAESSNALQMHETLEEAVESLFGSRDPGGKCLKMFLSVGKCVCHFRDVLVIKLVDYFHSKASTTRDTTNQPVVQEKDSEGEWIVQQTRRPRPQQRRESAALGQIRSTSQSPTPCSRHSVKP